MNFTKIIWNNLTYQDYLKYLLSLSDAKYADFSHKLTKTKYQFIGIKIPKLRIIAKEIAQGDYVSFFSVTQTNYIEEIIIEGLVISHIKDDVSFTKYFNSYLKLIDNWEINDVFCNSLKIMNNNPKYFNLCLKLAISNKEFRARVGLICLLAHYITQNNLPQIYEILDNQHNHDYYAKMAAAWLLCELYIKYPSETNNYLLNSQLDNWTFNKGIQKIRESYRIDNDTKKYLNNLKKKL
jgi:3-methyladenine DNA glycosylase AlkD